MYVDKPYKLTELLRKKQGYRDRQVGNKVRPASGSLFRGTITGRESCIRINRNPERDSNTGAPEYKAEATTQRWDEQ
jgi:hypothetical protein